VVSECKAGNAFMKVKRIQLQKKHCVQSQIAESTMGSIFYKVQKISYTKKNTNNVQNPFFSGGKFIK
jgi:pantothenate kinase